MPFPDDNSEIRREYYWIKKNGELTKFVNIRQLQKFYQDKKDLYKAWDKEHEVKFNDQESIANLVKYLETAAK